MHPLFSIVYAGHANGTHHKLALDALRHLSLEDADAWVRVFLANASLYMEGSKAPDDSFKDFKNHVLHVDDGFWGGAPEKVASWYANTVDALREERWADAVYSAGVMSHYYTDPLHPFHTGQTEAENNIHRAAEWSINRSYNDLWAIAVAEHAGIAVPRREGDGWIKSMVIDGAEFSHRSYATLMAHYDIHRGVVDPPTGLDTVARNLVAELLMYAAVGTARLLDSAIAESRAKVPEVPLTLATVMAAIQIPAKALAKRLSNSAERALVEAMYDELKATGRVEQNLPLDDRIVRDLHAKEILAPRAAKQAKLRASRPSGGDPGEAYRAILASSAKGKAVPPPASARAADAKLRKHPRAALPGVAVEISATPPATPEPATPPAPEHAAVTSPLPAAPMGRTEDQGEDLSALNRSPRLYLARADKLEAAPSIGPKSAERFAAIGIITVADFLDNDPGAMAELLDSRGLDAETLVAWQRQSHLMLVIPGLRGTHAQLIVGAGFADAQSVAAAAVADFAAAVLRYAATAEGKRILREGDAPDVERVKAWAAGAMQALAA